MVQPVSAILILIGLGFHFLVLFSPINHLRLNPSSQFSHLRSYALRVLYVFLHSSHLVLLPHHQFLSIGYRSSSSLSSSLSMSPRFRHCLFNSSPDPRSHPFSGFMAPLWILGLLFCLRPHSTFSASSSFRRNLDSSPHHRLFLSQHFSLRFRYPVSLQPNLHFRS